jgi:uncharacterized membrane-anchored protein
MNTRTIVLLVLLGLGGLWLIWMFSRHRLVWEDLRYQYGRHRALVIVIAAVGIWILIRWLATMP